MVHIFNMLHARAYIEELKNIEIRLWVVDLDCYVNITKTEFDRFGPGTGCMEYWELDVQPENWGKKVVYIQAIENPYGNTGTKSQDTGII